MIAHAPFAGGPNIHAQMFNLGFFLELVYRVPVPDLTRAREAQMYPAAELFRAPVIPLLGLACRVDFDLYCKPQSYACALKVIEVVLGRS